MATSLAQTYVRAGESYVVPAGIAYRVIDGALDCHRRTLDIVRLAGRTGWDKPPSSG